MVLIDYKEIANNLLKLKAIALSPDKPFVFASGIKSPIYCDNRILISFPTERQLVVDSFISLINSKIKNFDVVAGTATAGISWASWIADKLNKPMIYVRPTAKSHGKQNQIEGKLGHHQNVIVIEDLISTGKSSIEAINMIQSAHCTVSACFSIFSYNLKRADDAFNGINIPLFTLLNFSQLIDEACKQGLVSDHQKKIILTWNQNPESWGACE